MRELAEKFQGRLAKVEKNIEAPKQAKERELDLAQIDNNLQFIGILQKDDAPTLDSEVAKLTKRRADLEGANEEFERISTGLRDEFKLSPISLLGNKPIENAAANVSVGDFSSSNIAGTHVGSELNAEKAAKPNLPEWLLLFFILFRC